MVAIAERETRQPAQAGARPRRSLPERPRRRRLSERLTLNVVVGLVAALLAFVLAASLLNDRREMVTVAVARERIPAGAVITPELIESQDVSAGTRFSSSLVPFDRVADGTLVATRTVQPGEPLTGSAIGDAGSMPGQRVMSIPLDSWQAANGEIQIGDQVDVIEATKDGSRYVLTAAAVVGRTGGEQGGGLVGGVRAGELVISVEVDADEALDLALAIERGTIMVVRSTGAPPIDGSVVPEAGE